MHQGVRFLSVSALCLLTACAGAQSRVFVKEQVTWSDYRSELSNCYEQVRGNVPLEEINKDIALPQGTTHTGVATGGGLVGAVAVGIIGGIVQGIAKARAETQWAESCMENKGFVTVELDDSQRTKLGNLEEEHERSTFLESITQQQSPDVLRERAETARVARLETTDPRRVADNKLWESVKESDNPVALKGYLAVFPDGKYVQQAQARVELLDSANIAIADISNDQTDISDEGNGAPVSPQIAQEIVASFKTNKEPLKPQLVNIIEREQNASIFDKSRGDCWIELDRAKVIGKRSDGYVLEVDYSKPISNHSAQCPRSDARTAFLFSWDGQNLVPAETMSNVRKSQTTKQADRRPAPVNLYEAIQDDRPHVQSEFQNLLAKAGLYAGTCDLRLSDLKPIQRVEDGFAYAVSYVRQGEARIAGTFCSEIPETKSVVFAWNGTAVEAVRLIQ